jgi:hypothetical protein
MAVGAYRPAISARYVSVDRHVFESSMPYTFRAHDRRVIGAQVALGRAIWRARASQLLSQEALEARSTIDQSTISRLERGQAPSLRLDRLAQVLAGLGVDRIVVVLREDPPRASLNEGPAGPSPLGRDMHLRP